MDQDNKVQVLAESFKYLTASAYEKDMSHELMRREKELFKAAFPPTALDMSSAYTPGVVGLFPKNYGRWHPDVELFLLNLHGRTFEDCERMIGDELQKLRGGGTEVLVAALQKMEADLGKIRAAIGTNAMNLILGIRSEPALVAPYGRVVVRGG